MATFGFIGAGNMASAIVRGAVAAGRDPNSIAVTDVNPAARENLAVEVGVRALPDAADVVQESDFVVLSVKPQVVPDVLPALGDVLRATDTVLVSIAAGIPLARLSELAGGSLPVIRVMPNVNAQVSAGMAAVAGGDLATRAQVEEVVALFRSVGDAIELEEKHFAAYTAIAGSSPSWVFTFIEALTKAGVKHGLTRAVAARCATQAVLGSATLLTAQAGAKSASDLSDMVCSPGGTTIAGLLAAEAAGFTPSVVAAVDATVARDRELGV